MPHFGLMDPKMLGPGEGALQRARLHIRGGKRRLRQGKVAAGIVTLYDALESAMEWYVAVPERRATVRSQEGEDLGSSKTLFRALTRSGILNVPAIFCWKVFRSRRTAAKSWAYSA